MKLTDKVEAKLIRKIRDEISDMVFNSELDEKTIIGIIRPEIEDFDKELVDITYNYIKYLIYLKNKGKDEAGAFEKFLVKLEQIQEATNLLVDGQQEKPLSKEELDKRNEDRQKIAQIYHDLRENSAKKVSDDSDSTIEVEEVELTTTSNNCEDQENNKVKVEPGYEGFLVNETTLHDGVHQLDDDEDESRKSSNVQSHTFDNNNDLQAKITSLEEENVYLKATILELRQELNDLVKLDLTEHIDVVVDDDTLLEPSSDPDQVFEELQIIDNDDFAENGFVEEENFASSVDEAISTDDLTDDEIIADLTVDAADEWDDGQNMDQQNNENTEALLGNNDADRSWDGEGSEADQANQDSLIIAELKEADLNPDQSDEEADEEILDQIDEIVVSDDDFDNENISEQDPDSAGALDIEIKNIGDDIDNQIDENAFDIQGDEVARIDNTSQGMLAIPNENAENDSNEETSNSINNLANNKDNTKQDPDSAGALDNEIKQIGDEIDNQIDDDAFDGQGNELARIDNTNQEALAIPNENAENDSNEETSNSINNLANNKDNTKQDPDSAGALDNEIKQIGDEIDNQIDDDAFDGQGNEPTKITETLANDLKNEPVDSLPKNDLVNDQLNNSNSKPSEETQDTLGNNSDAYTDENDESGTFANQEVEANHKQIEEADSNDEINQLEAETSTLQNQEPEPSKLPTAEPTTEKPTNIVTETQVANEVETTLVNNQVSDNDKTVEEPVKDNSEIVQPTNLEVVNRDEIETSDVNDHNIEQIAEDEDANSTVDEFEDGQTTESLTETEFDETIENQDDVAQQKAENFEVANDTPVDETYHEPEISTTTTQEFETDEEARINVESSEPLKDTEEMQLRSIGIDEGIDVESNNLDLKETEQLEIEAEDDNYDFVDDLVENAQVEEAEDLHKNQEEAQPEITDLPIVEPQEVLVDNKNQELDKPETIKVDLSETVEPDDQQKSNLSTTESQSEPTSLTSSETLVENDSSANEELTEEPETNNSDNSGQEPVSKPAPIDDEPIKVDELSDGSDENHQGEDTFLDDLNKNIASEKEAEELIVEDGSEIIDPTIDLTSEVDDGSIESKSVDGTALRKSTLELQNNGFDLFSEEEVLDAIDRVVNSVVEESLETKFATIQVTDIELGTEVVYQDKHYYIIGAEMSNNDVILQLESTDGNEVLKAYGKDVKEI